MAENTTIEWATHTFNPWIGCTKISPACDNCYAANYGNRFGIEWGAGNPRKRTSESMWKQPLRWNRQAQIKQNAWENFKAQYPDLTDEQLIERGFIKPERPRVFCASLADVFDNEVDLQWRFDLFQLIAATPHLDWLLLTKRLGNVERFALDAIDTVKYSTLLPTNVWLGITICNQEEADRDIPKLLATPAAKRFVSIEPMLGEIDLDISKWGRCYHAGASGKDHLVDHIECACHLDWVICGGESGKNARPLHPNWVRSLRDQCADAGVPFLFKQWGEFLHYGQTKENGAPQLKGNVSVINSRIGKKQAGRLLDGVLHNEFPKGGE